MQKEYRNELIKMNRAMVELRSAAPSDETPSAAATWFERMGEKFGDFLAEPSAVKIIIIIAILATLVVLGVAFAIVMG